MNDATTRLFEYQDDKSAKFWEVTSAGVTVTVRYGKIGTTGQTQTRELADAAAAAGHVARLVTEKTGKGYVESGGATAVPAPAPSREARAAAAPVRRTAAPRNPARDPAASPESLLALRDKDDATNRLLARHPQASAALLEKLSHSSDRATRKAVCLNPNAQKDALLRLAPQFPGDFFRNPVFDWLLLEDPDMLFKLGQGVLKNILKRADCPLSFLQWAASHGSEQEQLAVAMNPNAPAELIEILAARPGPVASAAQGRLQPDTASPVDLDQAFRDEVRKALAEMNYEDFKSARKRGLIGLAQWPALNSQCRAQVLGLDRSVFALGLLPEAVQTWADHEDDLFRAVVAGYQDTPSDILSRMALKSTARVLHALASNPACPVDIMTRLAASGSVDVRAGLASNRNIPQHLLAVLAADSAGSVRLAVIGSACVTRNQLEILANEPGGLSDHEFQQVQAEAQKVLKTRDAAPATDPQTPPEQLAALALTRKADVRCAVAANPSTPEASLRALAANANKAIWQALTRNPRAPADLHDLACLKCVEVADPIKLREYVETPDCPPAVRHLAAARLWRSAIRKGEQLVRTQAQSQAPQALRDAVEKLDDTALLQAFRQDCIAMFERPANRLLGGLCESLAVDEIDLDSEQASACTTSKSPRGIRLIGLAHRHAAPDVLARRSKSTDWVERMAIAHNPSTPTNVLATLTKDPHALVARQAQATTQFKEQDRARQDEILTTTAAPFSLQPVVEAICLRLRETCRPWQVAGTRWWGQLTVKQRLGDGNPMSLRPDLLANAKDDWLRRAAAKNPQTPVPQLEMLAQDKDDDVRSEVASNPQTPVPLLEMLAQDKNVKVRYRVAENAQTPLPLLELLAQDKNCYVLHAVAKNPKTPVPQLEMLAQNKDDYVRSEVASNPQIPVPLLEMLAQDKNRYVLHAVAKNPKTPLPLLKLVLKNDYYFVYGMAESPQTPLQMLELLAQDEDYDTRCKVAKNPLISLSLLEMLAQDKDYRVRRAVAKNPQTPVPRLEMLAQDKNVKVRREVAENAQTPLPLLELLAQDTSSKVYRAVAKNPQTSLPRLELLLELLAQDQNVEVRCEVAGNPRTPLPLLEVLAKQKYAVVRLEVAKNSQTPLPLLELLAQDKSSRVRRAVTKNPQTPLPLLKLLLEKLAQDQNVEVRREVAGDPRTPFSLLKILAQDEDSSVRREVTRNPQIALPLLEKLAQDQNVEVRREVAKNPQTPLPLLEKLAQDQNVEVRREVAKNPQAPLPLLEILLEKLAQDKKNDWFCHEVAENPQTPLPLLELLAKNAGRNVRFAVAKNTASSWELLHRLSADKNKFVFKLCTLSHQSRRYVEHMLHAAEAPAAAPDQLRELAREGLWSIRWAALNNPSFPASARDAGLDTLRSEIHSALLATDTPMPPDHVDQQEIPAALQALDLMPDPTNKKALAAAAKSRDPLERVAAILTPSIQPSLLRMLLDDEAETLRHLAASKLREIETGQ